MKRSIVWLFITLLSLSLAFAGSERFEEAKTFRLQENSPISLSIENYKMKDGWTPVVLCMGGFKLRLWMDDTGRVSEMKETGTHSIQPVCFIDSAAKTLRMGSNILYFNAYEQNTIRTRWSLSPREKTAELMQKVNLEKGRIDFFLGNIRLQLNHVSWTLREISPGISRMQFHGSGRMAHQQLIYEHNTGTVYSTLVSDKRLTHKTKRVWAHEEQNKIRREVQ